MAVLNTFATRLKELREAKRLSQSQLANEIGVSRGSISFYENAERIPDIETLDKIVNHFKIPIDYMMGYTNTEKEENRTITATSLGLSDEAIERIISEDIFFAGKSLNIFNSMIESVFFPQFIKNVIGLVDEYASLRRKFDNQALPLTPEEIEDIKEAFDFRLWRTLQNIEIATEEVVSDIYEKHKDEINNLSEKKNFKGFANSLKTIFD
ncbi:MAG: helix-turn-helix domain-containing protein [Clostridiales bacterium]|nr:helix-turn-helix domain-containing protein [Clostridiales bacterium]